MRRYLAAILLIAVLAFEARAEQLLSTDAILEKAIDTAKDIGNPDDRDITIAVIAQVQAQVSDAARAQATAAMIKDEGWRSTAFEAIARACVERGDLSGALASADMYEDPSTHATLLSEIALAQAADQAVAATIFQKARDIARSIESPRRRGYALSAIALAQAKAGDRSDAKATLNEALLADESGREDTYLLIAKAQAVLGDRSAADATFNRVLTEARATARDGSRGMLLVYIAEAQAAVGDHSGAANTLEGALTIANSMSEPKERDFLLYLIAAAQVGVEVEDSFAFSNGLSAALNSLGEPDSALVGRRGPPVADVNAALSTVRAIEDPWTRLQALETVAAPSVAVRERSIVETIVHEMEITAAELVARDLAKAADSYLYDSYLIRIAVGDITGPLSLAKTLKEAGSSYYALALAASAAWAQAEMGDTAGASSTLREFVGNPRLDNLARIIALAQANMGDLTAAVETASKIIDSSRSAEALAAIAAGKPPLSLFDGTGHDYYSLYKSSFLRQPSP